MKFLKRSPLFFIILCTGLLFTIAGICGKNNIYGEQEYDPFKAPLLSIMFAGINEDIYPWQMFAGIEGPVEAMAIDTTATDAAATDDTAEAEEETEISGPQEEGQGEEGAAAEETPEPTPTPTPAEPTPEPTPTQAPFGEGRPEPLRESTHEEYLNHISADIYGDMGIIKAASYEFQQVDESYFDDALFIGDSRTVGLRDYTDLSEHADFFCETSLTIYKVMEEDFKNMGTIKEALENKDYGKIYIMVGINELGRGTTEDFMGKYTEVIDTLHELEPEAKIFIQGILRVTGDKDRSDKIFNNANINARNNAIATLADNQQVFYIEVNEVVCDEEGNLNSNYTSDQIHLLGVYCDLWKQQLLSHGVI